MSISEDIRKLACEGVGVAEVARRLGIRYQHAYNVLKMSRGQKPVLRDEQREVMLDLANALVLVACVSQKLSRPAPAKLLYCSEWFLKVRRIIERQEVDWLILSDLYGVVAPDAEIFPYDKTLKNASVLERKAWAESTLKQLAPYLNGRQRIVIFAGQHYRHFLVPALQSKGYKVEVPMANLRIGEQLAWLQTHA